VFRLRKRTTKKNFGGNNTALLLTMNRVTRSREAGLLGRMARKSTPVFRGKALDDPFKTLSTHKGGGTDRIVDERRHKTETVAPQCWEHPRLATLQPLTETPSLPGSIISIISIIPIILNQSRNLRYSTPKFSP